MKTSELIVVCEKCEHEWDQNKRQPTFSIYKMNECPKCGNKNWDYGAVGWSEDAMMPKDF